MELKRGSGDESEASESHHFAQPACLRLFPTHDAVVLSDDGHDWGEHYDLMRMYVGIATTCGGYVAQSTILATKPRKSLKVALDELLLRRLS